MEDETSNTILVVDDTPTNLNVLLSTLEVALPLPASTPCGIELFHGLVPSTA